MSRRAEPHRLRHGEGGSRRGRQRLRRCGGSAVRHAGVTLKNDGGCGDDRAGRQGGGYPVKRGRLRARIRGWAAMKRVDATMRSISRRGRASSKAPATGRIPNRCRIHAAWRASTEWIETAAASTASESIRGASFLYAATARSSSATAVLRNAVWSSVVPWKSKAGRLTAARPSSLRKAVT
jgi:hypothetical protein